MITLLIGARGSGKTKRLIDRLNNALETTKGNVVFVEKMKNLKLNYRARLVLSDEYFISGFDSFYGFLGGLCAGDHDITDIFIDATLRIGSRDAEELAAFLEKINILSERTGTDFTFTVSTEESSLPERIFEFCKTA